MQMISHKFSNLNWPFENLSLGALLLTAFQLILKKLTFQWNLDINCRDG